MALDIKAMNRNDQVVVGAGALMLLLSFLPWYGMSAGGDSESASAWDLDFFGAILAILLSLAAAGLVLAMAAGVDLSKFPAPVRSVVLGLAGASVLLIIIQWTADDDADVARALGIDAGWKFGFFLGLLTAIAQTIFAFLAFKEAEGTPAATAMPMDDMTPPAAPPPPPAV